MLLSLDIFSATNYTEIIYLWIYNYFYLWYFTLHLIYSTNIRTIKFEFHILSPSAEKWVWIEPDFSSFYCATNVFSMRRSDLEYHLIRPFFLLLLQKIKEISPQQQSIGYLKPTWIGFRLPNSQPPATLQFLCIYSTIYLQLASLSGPMVLGGLGRLRMTSLASWDFSTILSFNLTAVCIRRTLEDSLKKKAIPFSLISSQVQVLLKYERKSIFLIHKQ